MRAERNDVTAVAKRVAARAEGVGAALRQVARKLRAECEDACMSGRRFRRAVWRLGRLDDWLLQDMGLTSRQIRVAFPVGSRDAGEMTIACATRSSGAGADIRWARRDDADEIARLFLISSDGLAAYIWSLAAGPGQSLEEVGAARYAREGADFSYRNCLLAARGGKVLGMVHAFPMRARDDAREVDDPVLRPYAELEDPGSLYVSGLAVYPRYRGQGIGTELMDCVEALALRRGLERVSLICFEGNTPALAFYRKRGYQEIARRPVVPHPMLRFGDGNALLLARDVPG